MREGMKQVIWQSREFAARILVIRLPSFETLHQSFATIIDLGPL